MAPPRAGPMAAKALAAARRVPVRPGAMARFAGLGPRDLPALRGAKLRELALLASYLHAVPRLCARWAVELAEKEGVLPLLREQRDLAPPEFLARAQRRLGWAAEEPAARAVALALLEHLAELQLLAKRRGAFTWRGHGVQRDLALAPPEELLARELFAGTLAFYRACVEGLPEVLRGKLGPVGFDPAFSALWEGVLGDPQNLVLRRLALLCVPAEPRDVLDVACGTGHSTACLVERWPRASLVAIDVGDAGYPMVEQRARSSSAALGAPLDLTLAKPWPGWGEALPFPDGSFDLVFSPMNDGFMPPHRRASSYAELRRVLRPGGWLVEVTAPLPDDTYRPRAWELRAQLWLHHMAEFSVAGFHGLTPAQEHLDAAAAGGFDARDAWRLGGSVAVLRAPSA